MATTARSYALTARYQRGLAALERRLAAFVAATWDGTDGIDDQAAERFAAAVEPVDFAAQRHAVTLADAYIAAYLSAELRRAVRPLGLTPDRFTGPAVRNGATDVWTRPVVTARGAIARGRDYVDARAEARARAMATGSMNVALSARAASAEAMTTNGIERYRRVTSGKCCALCASAAGRTYRSADLMPLHNGCACGVEPVVETGRAEIARPSPVVEDSPEVAERVAEGEQVAKVVEHDELGPMLWQADHDFAEMS